MLDIPSWASRATLDVIGEGKFNFIIHAKYLIRSAAFDCEFGAMDNADNDIRKAYSNVLYVLFIGLSAAPH